MAINSRWETQSKFWGFFRWKSLHNRLNWVQFTFCNVAVLTSRWPSLKSTSGSCLPSRTTRPTGVRNINLCFVHYSCTLWRPCFIHESNAKMIIRQGWQNSIRHNLSLNDCFIKVLFPLASPIFYQTYVWLLHKSWRVTSRVLGRGLTGRLTRLLGRCLSKATTGMSSQYNKATTGMSSQYNKATTGSYSIWSHGGKRQLQVSIHNNGKATTSPI